MLNTFKSLITNQYEAVFCMWNTCIDRCPDSRLDEPIVNLAFCQVAFHTLFFADVYLGRDFDAVRNQAFHNDNTKSFRDYEELEDRKQELLYDRPFLQSYLTHCRTKAPEVIAAETVETLSAASGFPRKDFSRAELHVCNIRHMHHHAAQVSLRLKLDANVDIPWFASGWKTV